MRDLDRRFRSLDDVSAPDLWEGIRDRDPRRPVGGLPARRVLALAAALAVAAAAIAFAAVAFLGGNGKPMPTPAAVSPSPTSAPPARVSVSATSEDGTLRCTATFPSSVVTPGRRTGVRFKATNVSDEPVRVRADFGHMGTLVFRAEEDVVLTDTSRWPIGTHGGPFGSERTLRPGRSMQIGVFDTNVIWPGPLTVEPACWFVRLPPVRLDVAATSPPSGAGAALSRALVDAGRPFDDCRPSPDGVPVVGTVHAEALNFQARCSAIVLQYSTFDVIGLAIVAPADAPDVDLRQVIFDTASGPPLGVKGSVAVSWWTYVVTADRVIRVDQRAEGQRCGKSFAFAGDGVADCPPFKR
jgi:hypothetical protein